MIKRLAIIGVGLIGGSLALALKKANYVAEIVGYGKDKASCQQACNLAIIDAVADTVEQAVSGADMVVLAVPMGAMAETMATIAPHIMEHTIITDVGSAKSQVVQAAREHLHAHLEKFVPGHPIAGTEKSGPTAAFSELYQDHRVVLTPINETSKTAHQIVKAMWQAAGAEVFDMSVAQHDKVLAATSHLPHILAFNLVNMLAQGEDVDEVLHYAAGGFRDFSRISSSDPVMWRDICLTNSEAILSLLADYQSQLSIIEEAIRSQQGNVLLDIFQRAKQARDKRFNDPTLVDNSEV